MKRIFNIILFALFCTSFAQAQGDKTFEFTYKGQTLKYEVANGNEAMVSKQQSEKISGDVKIPERVTFEGKKFRVTTIGEYAFGFCESLTSVTIPTSVTTIGRGAFWACGSLKSIIYLSVIYGIRFADKRVFSRAIHGESCLLPCRIGVVMHSIFPFHQFTTIDGGFRTGHRSTFPVGRANDILLK